MLLRWVAAVSVSVSLGYALDNGLARTPPMGWISLLGIGCEVDCKHNPSHCLSDRVIRSVADVMVKEGFLAAGYEYIVIDGCWMEKQRGAYGELKPHRDNFKGGIRRLADYVHSKGLKLGISTDIGLTTCEGYPGSEGNEAKDIELFRGWQIDYVKLDACSAHPETLQESYTEFGRLLSRIDRPMLYSCSWPYYQEEYLMADLEVNYEAVGKVCNIWRFAPNVSKNWDDVFNVVQWFGLQQHRLVPYAGPGHFHDFDQLVVGFPELTVKQAQAQMILWAIVASPLMMAADLLNLKPEYKEILLDPQVIAINQDPLGLQGMRVFNTYAVEIWSRNLSNNRVATAILMTGFYVTQNVIFSPKDFNLNPGIYKVEKIFRKTDCKSPKTIPFEDFTAVIDFEDAPEVKAFIFTRINNHSEAGGILSIAVVST